MTDRRVYDEVQAALLNSECDPNEAAAQGLCALYSFVGTELEGSSMSDALVALITVYGHDKHLPDDIRQVYLDQVACRSTKPVVKKKRSRS